jgi:hypothetical protein
VNNHKYARLTCQGRRLLVEWADEWALQQPPAPLA